MEDFELKIYKWYNENEHYINSMRTTEDIYINNFRAQVKWWKFQGCLIFKIIEIPQEFRGQGLFTKLCERIITWNGIQQICLESVNPEIISKLEKLKWKKESQYSHNLFIYKKN